MTSVSRSLGDVKDYAGLRYDIRVRAMHCFQGLGVIALDASSSRLDHCSGVSSNVTRTIPLCGRPFTRPGRTRVGARSTALRRRCGPLSTLGGSHVCPARCRVLARSSLRKPSTTPGVGGEPVNQAVNSSGSIPPCLQASRREVGSVAMNWIRHSSIVNMPSR